MSDLFPEESALDSGKDVKLSDLDLGAAVRDVLPSSPKTEEAVEEPEEAPELADLKSSNPLKTLAVAASSAAGQVKAFLKDKAASPVERSVRAWAEKEERKRSTAFPTTFADQLREEVRKQEESVEARRLKLERQHDELLRKVQVDRERRLQQRLQEQDARRERRLREAEERRQGILRRAEQRRNEQLQRLEERELERERRLTALDDFNDLSLKNYTNKIKIGDKIIKGESNISVHIDGNNMTVNGMPIEEYERLQDDPMRETMEKLRKLADL